jgi:predicted nucleic acid-binding protein
MPFVINASVAACWLMPDEHHPIADAAQRRIEHESAVTPVLWWYELRNIMLVNERRGRLDQARSARALELLRGLPVIIEADVEEDALMRLARRHRLTAYDAAYLELAMRKGHPLATLDAALAIAARAEGVQLVGEEP